MKTRVLLTLILIVAITTEYAFSQQVIRETRNVKDFAKISFGLAGKLYINIGHEFKLEIEGEEASVNNISTVVSGSNLTIRKENWKQNQDGHIAIYITMPELNYLSVSGSGKAIINDAIEIDELEFTLSGSGRITTSDVTVRELQCRVSGSGNIMMEGNGKVDKANCTVSGSGNIKAESIDIGLMIVNISGSGSCHCNVTNMLKASISGSGSVVYDGNPKVDAKVSGSGRVKST